MVLRSTVQGDTARAAVILRLGLGNRPRGTGGGRTDWMGVGTSHAVELVRAGDAWVLRRDHALYHLYEAGPPHGPMRLLTPTRPRPGGLALLYRSPLQISSISRHPRPAS